MFSVFLRPDDYGDLFFFYFICSEFIEDLEADWFHLYTYDDRESRDQAQAVHGVWRYVFNLVYEFGHFLFKSKDTGVILLEYTLFFSFSFLAIQWIYWIVVDSVINLNHRISANADWHQIFWLLRWKYVRHTFFCWADLDTWALVLWRFHLDMRDRLLDSLASI